MFTAVGPTLLKIGAVVGSFGLLILVHEFGHFVVARFSGVRVLRFSIGFGPKIFGWRRGHTDYWVSWVPLGGYVKMAGEQRKEQGNQPYEYLSKPPATRALIVFAGPLVNYLSAIVFLWFFFLKGYAGLLPVVGEVLPDSPAQAIGLQLNDRIERIEGEPIETWDEMTSIIHKSAGKTLSVEVSRSGQRLQQTVTPRDETYEDPAGKEHHIGLIGIKAGGLKQGPLAAASSAITVMNHWTVQTLASLGSLVTGKTAVKESVTGPLGIIYLTSEAADAGAGPMLILISLFSLSLAIFNCLPIPVLDGGHLFFLLLEGLRGRPVSWKVQERAAMVSLVVLMSLALFISVNDIQRYWLQR